MKILGLAETIIGINAVFEIQQFRKLRASCVGPGYDLFEAVYADPIKLSSSSSELSGSSSAEAELSSSTPERTEYSPESHPKRQSRSQVMAAIAKARKRTKKILLQLPKASAMMRGNDID